VKLIDCLHISDLRFEAQGASDDVNIHLTSTWQLGDLAPRRQLSSRTCESMVIQCLS
jgi:hypothetical protein